MRFERLVAPSVSLVAVFGLLFAARNYDSLPLRPPPCSLRVLTGIPCVGCGGTRAMKALAGGQMIEAITFNPLAVLGVVAIIVWFLWTALAMKWLNGRAKILTESDGRFAAKSTKWWGVGITALVAINWIYLILFLPE